MERSEKRRLERERQKLEKKWNTEEAANKQWYSQLPINRKIFIGKFIERRTIENDNLVAAIMDKCMLGAMDDNTSIDIKLMKKVIEDTNNYILEYKEFLDKYKDGGFDMIENETVKGVIRDRMIGYINEGVTKVKCMAILKKEFNLPAAELSDMWVVCKEEYNAKMVEGIEKIDDPEKYIKESWGYDTTIKTDLEVVEEIKVIKGKYGYYHMSNDGLRFGTDIKLVNDDIAFKNKQRVIETCKEVVNDINKDIMILEEKVEKLKKDKNIAMDKYSEFEAAFDM